MDDKTSTSCEPQIPNIRTPEIIMLEAQLAASSADQVWQWLRARAECNSEEISNSDEAFEAALLMRGDPLINLALAQYGVEGPTLVRLFESDDDTYRPALRLEVLRRAVGGSAYQLRSPILMAS